MVNPQHQQLRDLPPVGSHGLPATHRAAWKALCEVAPDAPLSLAAWMLATPAMTDFGQATPGECNAICERLKTDPVKLVTRWRATLMPLVPGRTGQEWLK